jgi:hypothetical protein
MRGFGYSFSKKGKKFEIFAEMRFPSNQNFFLKKKGGSSFIEPLKRAYLPDMCI